ncbi:nuclease-related domain-containing protein [Pallidibacillus thermolactis]|jgi:Nuclease-related domain|uniref:nuclease-related domain-containing protein n=1 Tax=Pallidibacillus thermolactis TaxID=251051 RepID=UPI0021D83326|nr:nuclease-related domain-containing protein [Pallidibacillus thermolactis]MCU9600040.1 NERD domain-containing protein [Pallidibacillus thermolactis subsp. kokeshiiformis]
MIIKKREKSQSLQTYEVLLERLDISFPKRELIETDYLMFLTGFKGEKSIDYPLTYLNEKYYQILHDLRLFDGKHYFQIDTLIASQKLLIPAEIKNYSGILTFDPVFKQLIRKNNDKEEALPNPVVQVKRQAYHLKLWLENYKFKSIPIEPIVIMTNERAVIRMNHANSEVPRIVTTTSTFPEKIANLERQYSKEVLTKKDLRKLTRRLLKHHQPNNKNLLQQYGISKDHVTKGVKCDHCKRYSMERGHGHWICGNCGYKSKHAHVKALRDYALLFGTEITIKEAMDFMRISSRFTMRRILDSLGFAKEMVKNKLVYTIELEDL